MTETRISTGDDSTGLAAFLSMRPRLFGIAYRMLGSIAEAEDVVQDVWLRWQAADRGVVRDAAAFLATTARRLAINVMQSSRVRRETSFAACQSDPVDPDGDAGMAAERAQALASGVQILLERLTPTEQAAYVLREAFDYGYCDIAKVLRLAEANARQVVTRARQHLASERATITKATDHKHLLDAIVTAARGDVASLEEHFCRGRRRNRRRLCASRLAVAASAVQQGAAASA
jgi:RNA polymerase sigma-70 factor (ECF subfamily)